MDKKILILLPIWGREKIVKICFDNLKELQKDFNIDVLCVGSEQWAKIEAFKHGFKYVEAPNECLGTKHNIGIKEALTYKFDYLMNLGSDDIITKDLFKSYEQCFKDNIPMFGGTKLTFIDSKSKEACEFDYKIMIGAGRCIRKDALKAVYNAYGCVYDEIQVGLDMNSMAKFKSYKQVEVDNPFNSIYDIKSDVNIWDYEVMSHKARNIDFEDASKGLNTRQIDLILDL